MCLWPELSLPLVDKGEDDTTLRERVARLEAVIAAAGLEHVAARAPSSHPTGPTTTNDDEDDVAIDALLEPRRNDVTHHDDFDHQIISTKKRKVDESGLHVSGAPQPASVGQDVLHALPSRARCDHLVEVYFDRVEWIHHVIHRPSFDKWYTSFWTSGLGCIRSSQEMHPVALLFSMLCLALHFDDKLATPDWAGESRFFDASVKALQQGDYLRRHSVAVLQTLIMQGLWLNDQGMSSMHHANLGLAIRIANLMGLSRLDAQTNGAVGPTLEQEEMSFTERESKRRISWSLFCQDCYNASSCNFTYLIQSSQIKVDVFANLDDDELVRADQTLNGIEQQRLRGERGVSSLPAKPTSSSYHIAKIAFAETARRFADLYNANDLGYQSILALEKETCRCYEALPQYFQHNYAANLGPQMRWQQLFMAITFHNRIMRLHRPFLTRGYTHAEYRHSVTATVSSAKALLRLAAEGKPMSFPGLRWWVVLIHIFTAGVALCIDLHYHLSSAASTNSMEEGEDKERWVCRAIASLSDVRQFSEAANRAVEILETLYSQLREKKAQQILHQTSPPVRQADEAPDWTQLFEQALSDAQADYTTDQGILETINTFAFGVWPS